MRQTLTHLERQEVWWDMCENCWEEGGSPTDLAPGTDQFIHLANRLYEIHPTGGPLHAELDDWNLDGVIQPHYESVFPGQLGWDSGPAGAETRQLCDEIAALLNAMTYDQRLAAMAAWEGFLSPSV